MKIVILGSNGMLGYAASEYFKRNRYDVSALDRNDFDVLKNPVDKLSSSLKECGLVINCIGIIKQMIDEIADLDVLKINTSFPKNLAMLCKELNVPLIHITTDCVYSGLKGDYSEKDFFDANDLYGISKNAGETAECMTIRTSLIGPEKNRSRSLLNWAISQKGKNVKGFTNHIWNGLTTLEFSKCCGKIINGNLYKEGIFHVHSPDKASKYELIAMFNEIFNLNLKITPIETSEKCDRSITSIYELPHKLEIKSIREQILDVKHFFNL